MRKGRTLLLRDNEMIAEPDDAIKKILAHVNTLSSVERPLPDCLGHVAVENIYAGVDLPQSDISRFDGYAIRSDDLRGATHDNPAILRIIGTARAGCPSYRFVNRGTAIRIMTGAVVPEGADCVVPFEDTDEPGDKKGPDKSNPSRVAVYVKLPKEDNICIAGSKVRKGCLLVRKGTLIGPAEIVYCASAGITRMKVIRHPVVGIIATGDELIDPGKPLSFGKTYNCNTAATASFVKHYGGIPLVLGIARDTEPAILSKIRKGMKADAIVISGGVSKGDYDLVRVVLGKIGRIAFSRSRTGSGPPVAFGVIQRPSVDGAGASIPVFSLPGSPAGCLINFETLVKPALMKMLGLTVPGSTPHRTTTRLGKRTPVTGNKRPISGAFDVTEGDRQRRFRVCN